MIPKHATFLSFKFPMGNLSFSKSQSSPHTQSYFEVIESQQNLLIWPAGWKARLTGLITPGFQKSRLLPSCKCSEDCSSGVTALERWPGCGTCQHFAATGEPKWPSAVLTAPAGLRTGGLRLQHFSQQQCNSEHGSKAQFLALAEWSFILPTQ